MLIDVDQEQVYFVDYLIGILLVLIYMPFPTPQVRAYAVSVLERADDEELLCYLLQLVQALRFERSDKSRLSQFLVQRCKSYFLCLTM